MQYVLGEFHHSRRRPWEMKGGELNETPPQVSWVPNQLGKPKKKKGGGGGEGPASLWDSSSLQSLASTATGFCRADFSFGESHEKQEPS